MCVQWYALFRKQQVAGSTPTTGSSVRKPSKHYRSEGFFCLKAKVEEPIKRIAKRRLVVESRLR
jgi:hypothetical protein